MAEKYTHEQAIEAAERLASLYGVHTVVNDTEFPSDSIIGNYSFVGIHIGEICICAIDQEADIEALRKLAHIIVQTEEDMREEDPSLLVDPEYADTPNS